MPSGKPLLIPSIIAGGLLFAFTGPVSADSYTSYSYAVSVGATGDSGGASWLSESMSWIVSPTAQSFSVSADKTDTGPLYEYLSYHNPPDWIYSGPSSSTQQAHASASGSADFFSLHASASASASKTVGHYAFTVSGPEGVSGSGQDDNSSAYGYNGHMAAAVSYASATWYDSLFIESPVLPVGTPVDLALDWSLHSSFGLSGYSHAIDPNDPLNDQRFPWAILYANGEAQTLSYWNNGPGGFISGTSFIHTAVGANRDISAGLAVQTGTQYAYEPEYGYGEFTDFSDLGVAAFVDASHTALFALRVLTPDVTYTADSGRVYPTSIAAVPLPATLWLIGAALPGLGFALRRRAR
jgi:hypothetical protein